MKPLLLVICWMIIETSAMAERRLNPSTGQYDVVRPGDVLRYNAPGGYWTFAEPDARLELNPSTGRYVYPGEIGQGRDYNPVPREFRRDTEDRNSRARVRGWREEEPNAPW